MTFAMAALVVAPVIDIALVDLPVLFTGMLLAVARRVSIVVPAVLHEEHLLAASVVVAAVFAPVLAVPFRHAQVNWLIDIAHLALNDHRLRHVHRRRRVAAEVDAAIKIRLTDANADAGLGHGWCGEPGGGKDNGGNDPAFHR